MNSSRTRQTAAGLFLSVIVTAHDRKEYLEEAVMSLIRQDLPRDRFEIVVVKNFHDESLDRFLDGVGAIRHETSAVSLTGKILEGLKRARGSVVVFLEDDDLYESGKLRAVHEAFSQDPSLGFYRNNLTIIGASGANYSGTIPESIAAGIARMHRMYVPDGSKESLYPNLIASTPDFNASCMSIRRDILEEGGTFLARIQLAFDRFLFYSAFASPASLLLDDRQLTRYRLHDANTGVVPPGLGIDAMTRLDRIMRLDLEDGDVIYELVRQSGRRAAVHDLQGRFLVDRIYLLLRGFDGSRGKMVRLLRELPRFRTTRAVRLNRVTELAGALYVVSPVLGRRWHTRHLKTRVS